jgi:hypothetical protein
VDVGPIGGFGDYLRLATFPPEILLHQAEIDIRGRPTRREPL